MLKKLKALITLRSWLKSRTLNAAGVLGIVAGLDLGAGTGIVQWIVDSIMAIGLSQPTALALLVALKSVADVILRAKTDRALGDK